MRFLDAAISREDYDEMIIDLQAERNNLEVRLQRLSEADDGFNKTLATIFLWLRKPMIYSKVRN
ncbi:MAG: hypothetical protein A3F18_07790 [Legionellales bacterium RIFCSPHIGHO2_12_FULL_37_14]|nr:MAG: hypothetical protein A3F18_07790 [Legionellales bacterium RIFCSPHIGHO2_12_FULL_37_14]